jgi:hypothetical protein
MENWSVWIFVRESGRCPFDKWKDSNAVTLRDQAALDARVTTIESWSGARLPPETLKDYHGTNLKELKIRGDKKQLRPLCIVHEERRIIVLCGAIEKDGYIPDGDIKTGENLRQEYLNEKGSIKRYFKD